MRILPLALICSLLCIACTPPLYVLVPSGVTRIGVSRLRVNPDIPWNRVPFGEDQRRWETVWTQNGPQLDLLSLVGGLPEGKTIVQTYEGDEVEVPAFRSDMSAADLVSMLQAAYRSRDITTFEVDPAMPAQFLGGDGVRFAFRYTPADGASRQGVCVMRTVDRKFYAMTLDAESTHYFGTLLPEFEKLVASATLR
jgi:hypothetical protein